MNFQSQAPNSNEASLMTKLIDLFPDLSKVAITPQTDLFKDGAINSMDIFVLIEMIESEYNISILDAEVIPKNFSQSRIFPRLYNPRHRLGLFALLKQ